MQTVDGLFVSEISIQEGGHHHPRWRFLGKAKVHHEEGVVELVRGYGETEEKILELLLSPHNMSRKKPAE